MNRYFLNIGLWHHDSTDEMLVSHATASVEALGLRITRCAIVRINAQEPTLVVYGTTHLWHDDFDKVIDLAAQALKQDCIARWWCEDDFVPHTRNPGRLVGPKAAQWGEFNLSKFHFL